MNSLASRDWLGGIDNVSKVGFGVCAGQWAISFELAFDKKLFCCECLLRDVNVCFTKISHELVDARVARICSRQLEKLLVGSNFDDRCEKNVI